MIQPLPSCKSQKKAKIMKWIRNRVDYSQEKERKPYAFYRGASFYDCQLPPMIGVQPKLRDVYMRSIVDEDMKSDLEDSHSINWFTQALELFPVCVSKDGNCLLHAASMAVWGVEDTLNTLRDLLLMTAKNSDSFKKRWLCQLRRNLHSLEIGQLQVVDHEWDDVIHSISDLGSSSLSVAVPHRFLEGVHIYILANILRRPIIIITNGPAKSLTGVELQENHIGGLYLPLEWPSIECCKTPIILGYSYSHFCPLLSETEPHLLASGRKSPPVFPLVHSDLSFLIVRFLKEEEEPRAWDLVQFYLHIKEIDVVESSGAVTKVPFAQMHFRSLEPEQNTLFELLESLKAKIVETGLQKATRDQTYSPLGIVQPSSHPFFDIEMNSQTEVVPVGTIKDKNVNSEKQHNFNSLSDNYIQKIIFSNNKDHVIPTAPPISLEPQIHNEQQLSMMTERCINNCGYRCSNKTYPYCYECLQTEMERTKNLEQSNFQASIPAESSQKRVLESRYENNESLVEGATSITEPEEFGFNHLHKNVSLSSQSSTLQSFKTLTSQELEDWLQASEGPIHFSVFFRNTPDKIPKDQLEMMASQNCKNFQYCSGQRMLDHSLCFSCAKDEKNVGFNSKQSLMEPNLQRTTGKSDQAEERILVSLPEQIYEGNAESFAEVGIKSISSDIEVSEEPICKVKCTSPYCETYVLPPDKLCDKCKNILKRNYEQSQENHSKSEQVNKVVEDQLNKEKLLLEEKAKSKSYLTQRSISKGKHCIVTLCPNYGDPQMNHMCSSCFFKYNPSLRPHAGKKSDRISDVSRKVATRQKSHTEISSHNKHSQQITNTSPVHTQNLSDLRSAEAHPHIPPTHVDPPPPVYPNHYQHIKTPRLKSSVISQVPSSFGQPEPKSLIITSMTGHDTTSESLHHLPPDSIYSFNQNAGQSFEKVVEDIEKTWKTSAKKCITAKCENYGNKATRGYCNACFKVIRRQQILELEIKRGVNVPDNEVLDS